MSDVSSLREAMLLTLRQKILREYEGIARHEAELERLRMAVEAVMGGAPSDH